MTFQSWIAFGAFIVAFLDFILQRSHDFSVMDSLAGTFATYDECMPFNGAMTFQSWIASPR